MFSIYLTYIIIYDTLHPSALNQLKRKERKMKHWVYTDYSKIYPDTKWPFGKIVFECDALDILGADAKYKASTGKDIVKQCHVSVSPTDIAIK